MHLKIGLLWHSVNSVNLGVGALTVSNMAIIEAAAEELGLSVEFVVLGWLDPAPDPYITGPNITARRLDAGAFKPGGGFVRMVRDCDAVFDIGGGDSFCDLYGYKRFTYQAWSKWLVLLARRPLILSPQTIGPFRSPVTRWLARRLLERSTVIFARDRISSQFVVDLGVRKPVDLAVDVAFRLPYSRPPRSTPSDSRLTVGINVSALQYYGRYSGVKLSVDYKELTHRLIEYFSGTAGCDVVLVPHVLSVTQWEDDMDIAEKLRARYPAVRVAHRFESPSDAKSFIAKLDFFMGARMHACIAALSSGVPVVPLAYSRKFSGLFNTIGYPVVVDCTTETTDDAFDATVEAFSRRSELEDMVAQSSRAAEKMLEPYDTAVKDVLQRCANERTRASH